MGLRHETGQMVADIIQQIARERDEARAKLAEWEQRYHKAAFERDYWEDTANQARAIARQYQERLVRIRDHALSEFDRADSEEKAQAWFRVMNDAQVDDALPWTKDD